MWTRAAAAFVVVLLYGTAAQKGRGWMKRRRKSGLARSACTALAAIALVSACSQSEGDIALSSELALRSPGPPLYLSVLKGELTIQAGCVYVKSLSGVLSLPVFPQGSAEWDGINLTYRGRMYHEQDDVQLGGGLRSDDQPISGLTVPQSCDPAVPFFIVAE